MFKRTMGFKLYFILFLLILQGCASSGSVIVTSELEGYQDLDLKILPLNASKNNVQHNDSGRVSDYSPLSALIVSFNPDAYVYEFNDEDNENFEKSIFESLVSTSSFSSVGKVGAKFDCFNSNELCLRINILSTEVHNDAFLSVSIKGVVQLYGKNKDKKEFIINSKGSGPFTLSQSKNGAMTDFIEQMYMKIM